jgi:hypothetical protein
MANFVALLLGRTTSGFFRARPKPSDGAFEACHLGKDAIVGDGYRAERLTGFQLLAVPKQLARTEAAVKLLGMVNAEPVSVDQPKVINGCSDLLVEVLPKPPAMRVRPACPRRTASALIW